MAKAIISSVLEAQLGKYVDGLRSDSLQVGLWSGELTLQGLALKPHALAELNLPVRVVRGAVERVHVVVPWNQLGSASVQVSIEGVTALVAPNAALPSAAERRQHKQNQIERLELVRQHDRFTQQARFEGEDESTFLSRLTERIVDNLQVTLRDVHLRYEDDVSNPAHPFACGIMMDAFRFHSTDAEGRDLFVDRSAGKAAFTHKAASLTRLGVYWDRLDGAGDMLYKRDNIAQEMQDMLTSLQDGPSGQRMWILQPLSFAVQLTKNESQDYAMAAKYAIAAKVESLACGISREQYEDIMFLNKAFLGRRVVEAHFANARRRPFHSAMERPREWWDYSFRLVLARSRKNTSTIPAENGSATKKAVSTKVAKMRWSSVSRSLIELKMYIEAFRMELRRQSPLEPESKHGRFKSEYEMIYPVDVIMAARDIAEEEELREAERKKLESAKAAAASAQQGGGSWYSYFFGGSTESDTSSTDVEEDSILTAEGRADLKEAYDEVVLKETSYTVPSGCNLFSVKIQLTNGSLELYQAGQRRAFASARMTGSLAVNIQPFEEWDARFRLQHFEVLNSEALKTPFYTFCTMSPFTSEADRKLPCMSLDASMRNNAKQQAKDDTSTLQVRFNCMPIRLMVDPSFAFSLHHFFVSLLPDEQLEKVWQFATSSVSDWIFSDDQQDDEAVMQSIDTRRKSIEYDVLVDVNAPVIVIPENSFEQTGAVLVVDFGKLSFANDKLSVVAGSDDTGDCTARQLAWRLNMSNVRVLLGRCQDLKWTDAKLREFARLVEELSLDLSVKTLLQTNRIKYPARGAALATPQLEIQANVPSISVSVCEDQLVALGRIHSSIIAAGQQVASTSSAEFQSLVKEVHGDDIAQMSEESAPVNTKAVATSGSITSSTPQKYIMRVQLSLGEIVINVRESLTKDAFVIRLQQIGLDSSIFASHYVFEARLQSLVMQDKLYNPSSVFYKLISTGSAVDQDLISVRVLGFNSAATSADIKRLEAEATRMLVEVRCHILDIQWNPSSMALLYRIISAYASSLQYHDDFDEFEDALEEAPDPSMVENITGDSTGKEDRESAAHEHHRLQYVDPEVASLPAVLLRASLVQFSITFNKDQMGRQLVQLAMKDAAVHVEGHISESLSSSEDESTAFHATGHVGNFVVTDKSMVKHPIYSPLVGLDEREVLLSSDVSGIANTKQALLEFQFIPAKSPAEKSTLLLEFRPIRVVYFHQQILELVDYLLEGVMGAMVNQTLVNATQLLLSKDEASMVIQVSISKPSLVLPLRIGDANHLKVTADTLKLDHFPSSIVHYEGTGPSEQRKKTVEKRTVAPSDMRKLPGSVGADIKEISLVKARILCMLDFDAATTVGNNNDFRYVDILEEPIDMTICVEDLISANVRLKDDPMFLSRFTIESELDRVKISLMRTGYLSLVALIMENFGADEIGSSAMQYAVDNDDSGDGISLRPTVNYTYLDPNAEMVTISTLFTMKSVECRLIPEGINGSPQSSPQCTDIVDGLVSQTFRATSDNSSAFSILTADQFSFGSKQLRDLDPKLEIGIGALSIRDLAGEYLLDADKSGTSASELIGQHGTLMLCDQPTMVTYSWNEDARTCQLDARLSQVTGIVIPEALMVLADFFMLPTKPDPNGLTDATHRDLARSVSDLSGAHSMLSPSSDKKRRHSISEILRDAHGPEMAVTVNVDATRVGFAVPVNCCDPNSPRISCVADFSVLYTWKPGSKPNSGKEGDATSSDFDIQSSLVLDARRVEVLIANANRQGCCIPSQSDGFSVGTDIAALIQIIEPCELHVEISDLFPHARQKQQIVALRFTPIDVFISHDDVSLALEMADALNGSVQRYTQKKSAVATASETLDAPASSTSAILSPRAFQPSTASEASSALEVHRYFTLEISSVCLTLINDCDGCDMGLAQFQLERCNFFLNVTYDEAIAGGKMFTSPPATTISGGGSFVVLMSYYNPDTRDWHPMCTEWSMELSIQGCVYLDASNGSDTDGDGSPTRPGENSLHIILTANHPLEITVTHGLLEMMASAGGAWKRRSSGTAELDSSPPDSPIVTKGGSPLSSRDAREKRKHAPCVVRNETGVDFEFWLTNGRVDTSRQVVHSGDIADLRYTHNLGRGSGVVRKYASAEREAANMRLCVQLANTSFQPVQGIIFEQLGSRAFPLVDVGGHLSNYSLNCYAKLVDGRILLSVSSQVKVVNKMSMPIQLLVNDPAWKAPVEIGVLQPLKESAIPLLVSLGTELRARPTTRDGIPPFSWSAPIPVQQRSDVSLKVEASAGAASDVRSAVFAVSLSIEQSLRVVSFSEPIVLINKLPVPISFSIRNVMMNNQGVGSNGGGSKGETVEVGASCGIWWTDQQQRPLFCLNIQGCRSSKWIELIHPRTKMGTVLSITLERMDGRPFKMLMQVTEETETKAVHLTLYAEIWFINRTGLELFYGNESDGEAYMPPFEARALVGNAQICAYSTFGDSGNSSSSPTVRVGTGVCQWSTRFIADPRRLSWQDEVVTMRGNTNSGGAASNMLYEFGVSADYATRHFGSLTTLVSFFPRYLVMNHTPHTVLLYEDGQQSHRTGDGNVAHHVLAPGDTYALYWVTGSRSRIRMSVIGDLEYEWSGAFSVDRIATSDILIPQRSTGWSGKAGVPLQVEVKRGSISQSSIVVVINEPLLDEDSTRDSVKSATAAVSNPAHPTWDCLSLHAQVAGIVVTIADKKEGDGDLFGSANPMLVSEAEVEEVARVTVSRINLEASSSPETTSAKMSLMGLKIEDLLPRSKNPIVLCPVSTSNDYRSKYFMEVTYLEKAHTKYKWIERFHVELQDVRLTTSMRFVDRLNRLLKETVTHFENRSYSSFSQAASSMLQNSDDSNILQYFVPSASEDDVSMTSITGRKIYIESCEIAPVRVIVSFSRGKGDVQKPDPNAGFWLSNLKLKIENACLVLDAFKLSRAMGTQEVLADSLTNFYEKSVKSQALGLIDSIQVTSLVTSVVTGGVTSLVSTILGKTDPSLASTSGFRYQQLSNSQIINKHSRALEQCQSPTQFLEMVKHLVFDWDSNHTGLEARGCVALGILNNSRHSLVINAQLRDGAELRILPLGRRHLASVLDAPRSASTGQSEWRSDRAMVLFAFGYTPTPLTSGDVYFEVRSNACNVFVTRKTARLKANLGYTATFTHQETQNWWSSNVAIVGDDLHASASSNSYEAGGSLRQTAPPMATDSASSLFGGPSSSNNEAVRRSSTMGDVVPMSADWSRPSAASSAASDEEYEVTFRGQALGIIAKQSGRSVLVRECTTLPSGAPGPALATGRISPGDEILSVNGVTVTNTTQFRELVRSGPRPLVLRLRASGARYSAAYNLFGEAPEPAPAASSSSNDDSSGFDLFGVGR